MSTMIEIRVDAYIVYRIFYHAIKDRKGIAGFKPGIKHWVTYRKTSVECVWHR